MNIDQKIVSRLNELIEMGEKAARTRTFDSIGDPIQNPLITQWRVSTQGFLERVFGESSVYCRGFNFHYETSILSVLRAAKDDYENGYLFETRTLIQAEVFDDFLEQAQHLLDNGYYQPAAVVAGSVLEDGLRKLCARKNITLAPKPKLDTMNAELAKSGVYSVLVQKNVTASADLRNKAAHGEWDKFSKTNVEHMLAQVRSFMEEHFS